MDTKTRETLTSVFERWRTEDRDLEIYIREVREWMKEVEQLGIPHFGETATRLRPLRERLALHFEREDEMISLVGKSLSNSSTEFDVLRTGAAHDHEMLLVRIDDLSTRLSETNPPFESWQTAMSEVAMLIDELEGHETREATSIKKFLAKPR